MTKISEDPLVHLIGSLDPSSVMLAVEGGLMDCSRRV